MLVKLVQAGQKLKSLFWFWVHVTQVGEKVPVFGLLGLIWLKSCVSYSVKPLVWQREVKTNELSLFHNIIERDQKRHSNFIKTKRNQIAWVGRTSDFSKFDTSLVNFHFLLSLNFCIPSFKITQFFFINSEPVQNWVNLTLNSTKKTYKILQILLFSSLTHFWVG